MKRKLFIIWLLAFQLIKLYADSTDEQIRQYSQNLGVPYEALKQLVESYKPKNVPTDIIVIEEQALINDYSSNQVRADSLYKGNKLMVTGILSKIENGPTLWVGNAGFFKGKLMVELARSEQTKVINLSQGQTIIFIALCSGANTMGIIEFRDGLLVDNK